MTNKPHGWKDTSSYSQSDKERVPHEFTYQTKNLRIIVHRKLHLDGLWFLSCYELGLQDRELEAVEAVKAKKEGLDYVRNHVASLAAQLGETK